MLDLTRKELEDLVNQTIGQRFEPIHSQIERSSPPSIIGSLLHGVRSVESSILDIAIERIGHRHVPLDWSDLGTLSTDEIIATAMMYSRGVDLLISGCIDAETFGAGQECQELISKTIEIPFVGLGDEIYNSQSALSIVSEMYEQLGGLRERRLVISWGFGSKFSLPNTAHSLVLLAASLGSEIRVVAPPEFSLLKRVIKSAVNRLEDSGGSIEETDQFEGALKNADAVFGLNWASLENFHQPERNADRARDYRDWFISHDILDPKTLFMTEPPIEADLLASTAVINSERNLTLNWFAKRIQALMASISLVMSSYRDGLVRSLL
ncbi:MAG: hypothetical protein ACFE7R_01265 [Candidatus Hodarchaeota archaeon]